MNSEINILLYTEDQIFYNMADESEQMTEPEQNPYSDMVNIDIFTYDNLCVEYNFQTGETALYMQRPDKLYELLYHSDVEEDFRLSNCYSKNSAFVLKTANDKQIHFLDYYPRENFVKFMNSTMKYENTKNIFIRKLLPLIYNIGIASNSKRLIENSVYYTNALQNEALKEYKQLFIKYNCAISYIPISSILENTLEDINTYIATGNLDLDTLKRRLCELESFKKVCPNSCSLISNFINNPDNTDLKSLCDSLQKNMKNIENLMNVYMKNELNIQNRGEKDDCK